MESRNEQSTSGYIMNRYTNHRIDKRTGELISMPASRMTSAYSYSCGIPVIDQMMIEMQQTFGDKCPPLKLHQNNLMFNIDIKDMFNF